MVVNQYGLLSIKICSLIAFCLFILPIAIYFGTSAATFFAYLLYVVLLNIIPGTLLYCCLRKNWPLVSGLPVIGWVIGLSLETSLFNILDQFDLRNYLILYPITLIPICLLILAVRSNQQKFQLDIPYFLQPVFVILVSSSLIFIALSSFTPSLSYNFSIQAYISTIIKLGWPYQYFDNVPLFYNYLIHSHIASASLYTGVGTLELSSRSVPILLSVLCLSSIYFTGINIYKNKWVGVLVIAQIFGVIGHQYIQNGFFASAIPFAAVEIISTLAAIPIYMTLVSVTFGDISALPANKDAFDYSHVLIITILMWAASGMRTPALMAYGSGLGCLVIWNYFKNKVICWNYVLLTIISVIIFVLSLIRFYGFLSPYSATKFLEFIPGPAVSFGRLHFPLFRIIRSTGLPYYICGVVTFILMMLGKVTFLDGGIYWLIAKKQIFQYQLDVFWLGTVICGCVFWYFTYAPGGSNFTFIHYLQFGLAFIGARGLYAYCVRPDLSNVGLVVIALTVIMALLQFGETGLTLLRLGKNAHYQQANPESVVGNDFAQLIDWINEDKNNKCEYVIVGDMDRTSTIALSAEIVGIRQYGSATSLQSAQYQFNNEELSNRLGFVNALAAESQKKILDSNAYLSIKEKYGITQCLTIIVGNNRNLIDNSLIGNGWKYVSGRFAIIQ